MLWSRLGSASRKLERPLKRPSPSFQSHSSPSGLLELAEWDYFSPHLLCPFDEAFRNTLNGHATDTLKPESVVD